MIAIFLRELRDSGKWAFVAALVIAGIAGAVAYVARGDAEGNLLLLYPGVAGVLSVGSVAGGFMLGVLAVKADSQTGRWALLTHRPISRERIFLAKFLAALTLLTLAAGGPVIGLAVYAAIPGIVPAPFDWHMLLPRFAEVCAGGCCLAAGMLATAREGRLLGSRLLPALAASLVCGYAELSPHALPFIYFLLLSTTAVMAAAANYAFVAGGEYESQPWIGRALQTLVLGLGTIVVMLIIVGIGFQLLSQFYPPYVSQSEIYRLNGMDRMTFEAGGIDEVVMPRLPLALTMAEYARPMGGSGTWRWYCVPHQRTIVAYDLGTRRYAGGLGPSGFVTAPQRPQRFPDDVHALDYWTVFAGRYIWSFGNGRVTVIYAAPPGERIRAVLPLGDPAGTTAVITQSAIHLLRDGKDFANVPLDSRLRDFDRMLFQYEAGSRNAFFIFFSPQNVVIESDGSGHIVEEPATPLSGPQSTDSFAAPELFASRIFLAITAPPLLLGLNAWPSDRQFLWLSVFSAMAAASLCWLLFSRYAMNRLGRLWWLLACLAFGWTGMLLLVATRTAVARVKCSACGRKRSVSQDRCRHCGAPFPPPERTGVEVFAASEAIGTPV